MDSHTTTALWNKRDHRHSEQDWSSGSTEDFWLNFKPISNNQSNDKNETRHAKKILDAVNGLIAILDTANVDVFDEKLKELKSV